jgi:hypothetical protein
VELLVLVVILFVSISSEKVIEIVGLNVPKTAESDGEVDETVGEVVSMALSNSSSLLEELPQPQISRAPILKWTPSQGQYFL